MKIFVINLKSSVERRETMVKQLNKLELPYEIFEAVRGSELSEEEILSYYDKTYYRQRPDYYSPGMVGCTLSHFFLYKKMVEENIDVALILEDDMVLNKNLPGMLDLIAMEIRKDEVVMLFYQSYFPIELSASSATYLKDTYSLYQVSGIKGLRSTGGYIITLEAATSLAKNLLPFTSFPDDWKSFYNKKMLNGIRVVYPFLLDNTYQATTISPNLKGGSFIKKLLPFVENNKIFPVYQLLKWRRKINISKSRHCLIKPGPPVDFREI